MVMRKTHEKFYLRKVPCLQCKSFASLCRVYVGVDLIPSVQDTISNPPNPCLRVTIVPLNKASFVCVKPFFCFCRHRFIVHPEKSLTTYLQELEFLGMVVDTQTMELHLPGQKVEKMLVKAAKLWSSRTLLTRCEVSHLLGKLIRSVKRFLPVWSFAEQS